MFRHSNIWVNTKSGIRAPKDLIGKRVGMPEFQLTALVWIRGFLKDDHGVPVESVTYWTGGLEDAGRVEKIELGLPPSSRSTPSTRRRRSRRCWMPARSTRCTVRERPHRS